MLKPTLNRVFHDFSVSHEFEVFRASVVQVHPVDNTRVGHCKDCIPDQRRDVDNGSGRCMDCTGVYSCLAQSHACPYTGCTADLPGPSLSKR